MGDPPNVGDTIVIRDGIVCVIVRVHPAGTVDVRTPGGTYLRVSGLPFSNAWQNLKRKE